MKSLLLNLASLGSRLLNVLRGGSADITLSACAWSEQNLKLIGFIDGLFRLFGQEGHCEWAWQQEVARSQANIDRDQNLNP